jgi:hypothetical protein
MKYGINPDALLLDSDEYKNNSGAFASPPPTFPHPLVSSGIGLTDSLPLPHLAPRSASLASFAPRLSYWYRTALSHLSFTHTWRNRITSYDSHHPHSTSPDDRDDLSHELQPLHQV